MRADCSAITARSWCWTATADSAPNSRSSSLARWPFSGANTSSTRLPRNSATVRAFSVNAPSTSRETFSNSVRTKSALTSACSRESTRAPISIASTSTAAGSAPASLRSRTRSTAQRSRTARASATTTSPKTATRGRAEWRGGFHTVESHGTGACLTERTRPCSRASSAHVEARAALGLLVGHVEPRHLRVARARAAQLDEPLDGLLLRPRTPPRRSRRTGSPPSRRRRRPAPRGAANRGRRPPAPGRGRAPACARSCGYRRPMAAIEALDADITTLEVDAIANAANTRAAARRRRRGRDRARGRPGDRRGVAARAPRSGSARRSRRRAARCPAAGSSTRRRWSSAARRRPRSSAARPRRRSRARRSSARAASRSSRSAPASAASRSTRRRGSRSRRSAATSTPGSQLERIVFAVHGEPARAAFQAAIDAAG